MANEEHLAMLTQGVALWNQWRKENPTIKPDLNAADLSQASLSGANLFKTDLSDAELSKADLRQADLRLADLFNAKLRQANLSQANLSYTDLRQANLMGANLHQANLSEANLSQANLYQANLRDADLRHATLNQADLHLADLHLADIGWTVLGNVDLSEVNGLESVRHAGPSTIGVDTIYRSKGHIPPQFLLDTGMPQAAIDALFALASQALDFYSCFISYSSHDQDFAERLHADLQAKGVRCWYAAEDLTIGEPFLLGIDKGIRLHDKLLLVLSEHSIESGWVQHEVLSALAKEQGKEPWVLFPVRLDDTVLQTSVSWANMIKQSRHIGDFTHWKDHDTYQKAFERLLRDLKMGSEK